MNSKPNPKPILPFKVLIDGHASSRKFFKHHPKLIHSLEIDQRTMRGSSSSIRAFLFKTLKKMKFSSRVSLHNVSRYSNCRIAEHIKIIKRLRDVKALSFPLDNDYLPDDNKAMKELLLLKRVRLFYFPAEKLKRSTPSYFFQPSKGDDGMINKTILKVFDGIKRSKLEKIKIYLGTLTKEQLVPLLTYSEFPRKLKGLSIRYQLYRDTQIDPKTFQGKTILSNLTNLEAIQLATCSNFRVSYLKPLLASLPHPERLMSLSLTLQSWNTDDENKIHNLEEIFQNCHSLKTFKLSTPTEITTFRHLNFLKGSSLKHLELAFQIRDETLIMNLGYLLGSLQDLESLKLGVTGRLSCNVMESYFSFFGQLSELSQLCSLNLAITTYAWPQVKIAGLLDELGKCIDKLPELKDLAFRHIQADYGNEFGTLIKPLRNKAKQLRKLRLDFEHQTLKPNDSKALLRLIEEAKDIQILKLSNLVLKNKDFLDGLNKGLSMSRNLKTLELEQMSGVISTESFEDLAENILKKRGVEKFYARMKWTPGKMKKEKKFTTQNIREILERNPYLKSVRIPNTYEDMDGVKWEI